MPDTFFEFALILTVCFLAGYGAEFTARISKVQAGKAKSCGCRQYNRNSTGSLEQLIKHVKIWHAGLNKGAV